MGVAVVWAGESRRGDWERVESGVTNADVEALLLCSSSEAKLLCCVGGGGGINDNHYYYD